MDLSKSGRYNRCASFFRTADFDLDTDFWNLGGAVMLSRRRKSRVLFNCHLVGEVDMLRCKPMDAEECEPYTDVFFIKFSQVSNARFAKRKLDESVFLGNRLQVSYALQFESLSDTKEKLEARRKEVLCRIKFGRKEGSTSQQWSPQVSSQGGPDVHISSMKRDYVMASRSHVDQSFTRHVSSNKDYFPLPSMNETVRLVREKLDKIQSSSGNSEVQVAAKKSRVDNRRRI
ncbi:uncharacterized protein [Typha angustifolia]|uniref:uncharacterized protein isoform X2 n=1 Tax=Typha angustifolia TaxID=59011 RepID=UPI003C2C409D